MRGKGEGSIYRRADGRYTASITLEAGPDGKRRRKDFYGRSRRDVLAKLDKAREELRQGQEPMTPESRRITVGDLLDEWLESIEKPHSAIRPLTQAQYRTEAETRIRTQLGAVVIRKLTDTRITAWQDDLLSRYAPRSILKARTVLAAVIMLARRKKLLFANPLELVHAPTTSKPTKRAISGDEAARFLMAIRGHRYETLFLADLLVGTRRGEILAWHWSDVDLDSEVVRIRHQLQRLPKNQGLRMVATKSDAGERLLPLPSLLVARLRELRAAHPDAELVFPNSRGKPLEPSRFNKEFKDMVRAAGLAPLTPHELRHSMSTILQHLGVRPVVVSALLGHADPSVTLRWYTHDIPEDQRDAMDRMDRYITRLMAEHDPERSAVTLAVAAVPTETQLSSETTGDRP